MRLSMLTNRKRIHVSSFGLFFGRKEDGGNSGYEFPCNANGFILGDQYQTAAQRNESAKLLRGDSAYLPAVIVEHKHSYMEPATGRCSRNSASHGTLQHPGSLGCPLSVSHQLEC